VSWIERARRLPPVRLFHLFGIAGSAAVAAGSAAAAAAYRGAQGEPYSVMNHFISELGRTGVSRLSWAFNGGLIAGGVLFTLFVLGLGITLGGFWAACGTAAGVAATVAVAFVGVFPMNDLQPHIAAAMTYFRSGLAAMLLFGVAIQRQPPSRRVIDRRANAAGFIALFAYALFLVWLASDPGTSSVLSGAALEHRPAVWPSAILEWSVMIASVAWFLVVALCRRSARPGGPRPPSAPVRARQSRIWSPRGRVP